MPIDVTDKYIRVRVEDPDKFVKESLRTIWISRKEGIKSIVGKLKANKKKGLVNQNFMFERSKGWTKTSAKEWVESHGYTIKSI